MNNKHQIKRTICGIIMAICILLLLGYTGACENGDDLAEYTVKGTLLLIIAIIAGLKGKWFG